MNNRKTIALLSGGLDSATAAAIAKENGHEVIALSFDYGQRHRQELQAATKIANHLKLKEHQIIKINLATWGGSSLTDIRENLPTSKTSDGVIPNTYVPGRNTIFIAIALSLAEVRHAKQIVLGINAMDYSGYPDCRPDYLEAFQKLASLSNKAGREGNIIKLWAPLVNWKKTEIIKEALRLNLPIDLTWSCYSENANPCGKCDSCRIRDEALEKIGRPDLCSNQRQ
ncbi:7-cyano-7-deazaguanine synthase QueC [Prochlorococcus sp. MIT 1223]|uniref:7-cyano-7-deazaguanine synthase QueC n=1 Tax=Prochlorococcus sp. MIT 1223 TaxID=3096217 RepID=UPI002A75FF33|nr:7-cyano-7-deazaguanine synthase QueC [Prochlorococcus sp. MIT 1223]